MTEALETLFEFQPLIYCSQDAIDRAKRHNPRWCVLVNGICFTLPGAQRVHATAAYVRFSLRGHRYTYVTPPEAAQVAVRLDKYGKSRIRPFQFQLGRPVGIVPVQNSVDRPRTYQRTGKYREQSQRRRCGTYSARRWHGLVQ